MKILDTVLIVEDDPIASLIIRKRMSISPLIKESKIFANGELALAYIQSTLASERTMPDLILLDINMPVMNGWQFLEAFNSLQKPYHVPIIMLTSSIDPEDKEKAYSYQFVKGFLSKPFTTQHLEQILSIMKEG